MTKGTLRPLFQAPMPKQGGVETGDFLIMEATPKPDGEEGHRYWGVAVKDDRPWVIPLHADVDYPSGPQGEVEVGPLMQLTFRQCPALDAARIGALTGNGDMMDLEDAGLFGGTLDEWAESIGYEILNPPSDEGYEEVRDA